MIAWTLFYNPLQFSKSAELWLLLPLLLAVAVIYRTVRTKNIHRLPREILVLFGFMVVALVILGGGVWIVLQILL